MGKQHRRRAWMNINRRELPRLQGIDVVNRYARMERAGDTPRVVRCPHTLGRKPIYDTETKARQAAEALMFINPGEPLYPYPHGTHWHLSTTEEKD